MIIIYILANYKKRKSELLARFKYDVETVRVPKG